MRKFWSTLALLMLTATLAACGGGSSAFETPASNGSGPAATVAVLKVASSVPTLPPDGTTATITVTATDQNNAAVPGAVVTFATSAGVVAVTEGTTGSTGQATATLSAQGVTAGTVITVTATSNGATGKTTITVASTQQTLTLSTSVPQIPTAAGSSPAIIKALVVDGSNNVVAGVPVSFQATSGALTVTQGTTDSTGTAIATLSAGTSSQNRLITVTASSGTSSATIEIAVIGTTVTLNGPSSLVQGAQGTYTATLADSGGTGIVGQAITLSSTTGNTIAPASVTTGTLGTASFTLTAANAGTDTLTADAYGGALSATQQLSVSNQNFTLTAPAANATIPVGLANAVPVTVTWANSGGTGQSGTVNFSSSRGTVTPSSVTFTAGVMGGGPVTLYSVTAGDATLSATAIQGGITVATAQTPVSFIAPVSTAAGISVQANPSSVLTQGQSTVVATVVDGFTPANPVLGATVDFTLTDSTGGTLSAGSAVTNKQGQATVTYTASTGSSQPGGVTIQATLASNTSITGSTTLTVGGQTAFLSLGTGNTITEYSSTQYELPYTVQAVDSSGHGLSGVTITYSLQSISYTMGAFEVYTSPSWAPPSEITASNCPATHVYENNGVIVSPVTPPVPSGYVLTAIPGSVASTDVSSSVTSAAGSASVNLIYPKDHAYWVQVALTATATVAGTQNSTTATFLLPGATADYSSQSQQPPGPISPYGTNGSCYPQM